MVCKPIFTQSRKHDTREIVSIQITLLASENILPRCGRELSRLTVYEKRGHRVDIATARASRHPSRTRLTSYRSETALAKQNPTREEHFSTRHPLPRPDLIVSAGTDSLSGTQLPKPSLSFTPTVNTSTFPFTHEHESWAEERDSGRGHFFPPTRFACGGRSANFMSSFRKLFIRLEILLTACSGHRRKGSTHVPTSMLYLIL